MNILLNKYSLTKARQCSVLSMLCSWHLAHLCKLNVFLGSAWTEVIVKV